MRRILWSHDSAGMPGAHVPTSILIHGDEVFILLEGSSGSSGLVLGTPSSAAAIHVYSKSGSFLHVFAHEVSLSPEPQPPPSHRMLPRGIAVCAIRGVDHLLVASHRHVHVLTLPDGGRRQILAVPDALYLNALCVHEGRVFACDSIGHRVHVLELRDDCS